MSLFHVQRYIALKIADAADDDSVALDGFYQPFKALARQEFGDLGDKLFGQEMGEGFVRALQMLPFHGDGIIAEDYTLLTITEQGKETLQELDKRYAQPARPINGVNLVQRQQYLYLKALTKEYHNGVFSDHMQNIANMLFGEGNHDNHSGLYDIWSAQSELTKAGLIEFVEGDPNNDDDWGEERITEKGREHFTKMEAIVAPAFISNPSTVSSVAKPKLGS